MEYPSFSVFSPYSGFLPTFTCLPFLSCKVDNIVPGFSCHCEDKHEKMNTELLAKLPMLIINLQTLIPVFTSATCMYTNVCCYHSLLTTSPVTESCGSTGHRYVETWRIHTEDLERPPTQIHTVNTQICLVLCLQILPSSPRSPANPHLLNKFLLLKE